MIHLFSILATSLYAIIGGPSVGKTSIINELNEMGEIICHESATDIIASYQSDGIHSPWELPGFESEIFLEKVKREFEALDIARSQNKHQVFTDRGLLDTLVYLEVNDKLDTEEYAFVSQHLTALSLANHYKAAFFVEPHSGARFIAENSGVRHEDTDESIRLGLEVRKVYEKAGIPLYVVPPYMTANERAEFVLDKLQAIKVSLED